MGTPHFAAHILTALIQDQQPIVGVVTVADKAAGRGKKIQESPVKTVALSHGIPVLQPLNLKDPEFLVALENLQAAVFVVVAFRMLPEKVWRMPPHGTFNLHASLLPQYRGAAPINWAIINGELTTGVTTFFIDHKIDTGEIIACKSIRILPTENAGSLHDKLMELGAALVLETLGLLLKGEIKTKKQTTNSVLKEAPKIFKEDCKINWNLPGKDIYNFIRGMSPYPTAWTTLFNKGMPLVLKIYETRFEEISHSYKIGFILKSKKELKIAVVTGFIHLLKIQLPGKRIMPVQALLNGFHLEKNAYLS